MVTLRQVTIPPVCGVFETLIFKLCFMFFTSFRERLFAALYLLAVARGES
ncbi:hypothetical protein CIRMBP1248_00083 [Enterococcus cecorum]|nr:hypothetical protein CIRMBP1216_00063 [Enterococcus cecorum]CAI3255513.1 hypothetical protein CIRMBP1218_00063 [Enterococcus cecorum]CAI3255574.1 hypothetical protein CIRMBP1229_00064 [Enterococcus cecorum]CAI3255729.1 hypothetical protein CIRMBP1248_00083 [Enterococcus cecorum]CAI3260045.1 hypothetical protein CIRMBP1242_00135 [Enterococcus cecorum]